MHSETILTHTHETAEIVVHLKRKAGLSVRSAHIHRQQRSLAGARKVLTHVKRTLVRHRLHNRHRGILNDLLHVMLAVVRCWCVSGVRDNANLVVPGRVLANQDAAFVVDGNIITGTSPANPNSMISKGFLLKLSQALASLQA